MAKIHFTHAKKILDKQIVIFDKEGLDNKMKNWLDQLYHFVQNCLSSTKKA